MVFLFVFMNRQVLRDPGLGWHLLSGRWILESMSVPLHDPFLYSPEFAPWVHDQWLGSVFLASLFSSIGIVSSTFILGLAIWFSQYVFLILYQLKAQDQGGQKGSWTVKGRRSGEGMGLLTIWFLICLLASSSTWVVRPVIFSFILFALLVVSYLWNRKVYEHIGKNTIRSEELRLRSQTIFNSTVFLIFALWSNVHGAWILALLWLAVILILEGLLQKRIKTNFFSFLTALLATFCNPYFYDLHKSIYRLLGSSFFMNLNEEWLAPQLSDPTYRVFFMLAFIFVLFCLSERNKKNLPLLSGTIFLLLTALYSGRNVPFFSISCMALGPIFVLPLLMKIRRERESSFIENSHNNTLEKSRGPKLFLCLSFVVLAAMLYLFKAPVFRELPLRVNSGLIDMMNQDVSCGKRIFSHPDWGGSLVYTLNLKNDKNRKLFVDDRNQVNPEWKYLAYFDSIKDPLSFEKYQHEINSDVVLVQDKYPLFAYLSASEDWKFVGKSDFEGYGEVGAFCRQGL